MGILKIKAKQISEGGNRREQSRRAEPQVESDPFEMFTIETFEPPRSAVRSRPVTDTKPLQRSAPAKVKTIDHRQPRPWLIGVLLVLVAGLSGYATFEVVRDVFGNSANEDDRPFAYFEIRVIDGNGHPVTGASVRSAGKKVGTTDSFGEWRRYIKVTPGSTVTLGFSKKVSQVLLAADKNFAVPAVVPREGDLSVRGTVQLLEASRNQTVAAQKEIAQENIQPVAAKPEELNHTAAFFDSIAIGVESGSADIKLARDLVDAMRQRAIELGLTVNDDAKWKVTVSHLIAPAREATGTSSSGGLFLVRSRGGEGQADTEWARADFLRSYESTPRASARGALWILSMHMRKDYPVSGRSRAWTVSTPTANQSLFGLNAGRILISPQGVAATVTSESMVNGSMRAYVLTSPEVDVCPSGQNSCTVRSAGLVYAPPVNGWQRHRLKLVSPQRGTSRPEVYLSGYAATPADADYYEFWGAAGTLANVTVIQDNAIVYRDKVAIKSGTPVVVAVPAMALSRR